MSRYKSACMLGALALSAILAAGRPALAQSPEQLAKRLVKEAKVHYNMGQNALAAAKLQTAIRALPDAAGPYRLLGLTYRSMKKCDLALPYFQGYIRLAPDGKYAPRVRKEIAWCQEKLGITPSGTTVTGTSWLLIRVNKDGAKINIDGVLRGTSPSPALPVQPGNHVINVFLSGYLPWNGRVRTSRGQVKQVDITLERDPRAIDENGGKDPRPRPVPLGSPGKLQIMGVSRKAAISLGGVPIRLDENSEARVEPGKYRLEVYLTGTEPWSRKIEIVSKKTTSVLVVLEASKRTRTLRKWAWVATGAALALGVAGGAVGLVENGVFEDVRDYDPATGTRAELNDMVNRRHTLALTANILYGLAAAALSAGIIMFTITPEMEAAPPGQVAHTASRGASF